MRYYLGMVAAILLVGCNEGMPVSPEMQSAGNSQCFNVDFAYDNAPWVPFNEEYPFPTEPPPPEDPWVIQAPVAVTGDIVGNVQILVNWYGDKESGNVIHSFFRQIWNVESSVYPELVGARFMTQEQNHVNLLQPTDPNVLKIMQNNRLIEVYSDHDIVKANFAGKGTYDMVAGVLDWDFHGVICLGK